MAKLTHTVSSNNIASFRSADIANIESLKCHFLPVQEGSGDPSPENVRPINGWQGCNIYKTGKNIGHVIGYSVFTMNKPTATRSLVGNYGTTISTIDYNLPDTSLTITQTEAPNTSDITAYNNGYFCIGLDNLIFDQNYDVSFKVTNITNNLLNVGIDSIRTCSPGSNHYKKPDIVNNDTLVFRNVSWKQYTYSAAGYERCTFEIRNAGLSFTLSEFMVTPVGANDGVFEPYNGNIIPITFPTTGKNKLNPADIYIYDNHFTLNNGVYTSTVTDTRDYTQLSVQLWKTKGSYLKTLYVDYLKTTGRHVLTFTVDDPKGEYICLKHNGIKKDFILLFPVPLGLRQYTISLDLIANDPTTVGGVQLTNIQLEVGDTATEYEPYADNLDNTIYGGYVDIAKGEIVETHKKKILNGTETWSGYRTASDPGCHFVITLSDKKIGLNSTISDTFPNANNIYFWDRDDLPSQFGDHGTLRNLYFNAPYPMTNGIAEWKQWLSEHNVTIVYPLENPIHYPILKQNITSFLNQNNIWSNANDIIEVEYSIIDHLLQKRMNIPKLTSKVIWNQLVYPQKRNGPVVTSSGDGIFHVTVTMASTDYYTLTSSDHYMTIIAGHKYYLRGCPVTDGSIWFLTTNGNNGNQNDKGYGTVATFNKSSDTVRTQIRLEPGTYDFYIKPIIVDLTQMFGAGNEPTKEEFEQLCKYNGVDLTQVQPFDLGSEKIWYINNYEITKYNTVEWNQLDPMLNSSNWEVYNSSYASVSFDDGVATRTVLQDVSSSYTAAIRTKFVVNTDTTHQYYIKQELYSSVAKTYVLTLGANWCRQVAVPAEEWTVCEVIGTPISSEKVYAIYDGNNGNLSLAGYTCKLRNPLVIDLTQMFGAGNEPTLQEFRALCTANGVNLDSTLPRDTGTKQLWII